MDKNGANVTECLAQMERKLHCIPLLIHYPIGEGRGFRGFVDLVSFSLKEWDIKKNPFGKVFQSRSEVALHIKLKFNV